MGRTDGMGRATSVPLLAGCLLLAPGLAACGDDGDGGDGDGLRVVTTVAPLTSIAASIGGDRVEIDGLVPEGSDSHTFEPPPSAARQLSQADVLLYNGLGLEEPIRELAEANLDDAPMVALGEETISPDEYIYDRSFPEEAGNPNPHLWTNPPMARTYGRVVMETLSQLDPDHAEEFEANYQSFAVQVDELDQAMVTATDTVPPDQRKLLTYHDAYPYFAAEYGWEVVGAIQPAHFGEPSSQEVADLIEQIETEDVPAIFGSEVFPDPVLERISAETGADYHDDMRDDDLPGEPGEDEHSWLGLMRFNFVTMVEALGGDPAALEAVDLAPTTADVARYPE